MKPRSEEAQPRSVHSKKAAASARVVVKKGTFSFGCPRLCFLFFFALCPLSSWGSARRKRRKRNQRMGTPKSLGHPPPQWPGKGPPHYRGYCYYSA